MATQHRSKKAGSSHAKSSGSRPGSTSGGKSRNGSGGRSDRGPSARHGRPGQRSSERSKGGGNEGRAGSGSQEQGGGMSRAAEGAKGAGSKMVDSVKQHPIAASAIGVGIAAGITYMAVRAFRDSAAQDQGQEDAQQDQDYDESEPEMGSQTEGEEDDGGEEEEGGEEEDEEDPAGRIASRMKQGAGRLWESYPLAVSAGILGVGVAAGMLLPSTRSEKRLFGGTSGKLTGRLRSAGQELLEQGKEIASKVMSETTETLQEEAEREGLTPDRLSRKVKRIASKVKDAVVNAATD